jgi:hypothetical protein
MIADRESELHEFAAKIGMKREWFQPRHTHYDVFGCMVDRALANGAIKLTPKELVGVMLVNGNF